MVFSHVGYALGPRIILRGTVSLRCPCVCFLQGLQAPGALPRVGACIVELGGGDGLHDDLSKMKLRLNEDLKGKVKERGFGDTSLDHWSRIFQLGDPADDDAIKHAGPVVPGWGRQLTRSRSGDRRVRDLETDLEGAILRGMEAVGLGEGDRCDRVSVQGHPLGGEWSGAITKGAGALTGASFEWYGLLSVNAEEVGKAGMYSGVQAEHSDYYRGLKQFRRRHRVDCSVIVPLEKGGRKFRFRPFSHVANMVEAGDGYAEAEWCEVVVPYGHALVFRGDLWHGGGSLRSMTTWPPSRTCSGRRSGMAEAPRRTTPSSGRPT